MKRRPLPYGFHYNIPTAFDPSVSYDMQYQRLREIVYSIIDNMEIHIPYMIFTTEAHTNDVVTLTGSFYTDHKEVLANKTFSLKGLPDGTYYININAKYKFEPCEPDCSCVKAISPDSDMTLETVYMPEGGITLYTVVRKNGEITAVNYNDIYTGMHNIAPDAHENRFSDVYAKIKAEVDRATAAEETLQHNIDNETARAMDAENVLDEKIKTEQNRATAAEHTLQDNINKEQARAEQAESTLQANLTGEINRAKAAESGLQKNIDTEAKSRADGDTAERTRAVAAENTLQQNIDNEITNRTSADTAERTRALAAEDKLQKNIDNEVANRTTAVTAEKERAVNAENELAGDIASESADRQRADTALETKLTGLINAEETRATQAEGNLKTAIDTEETARMNADSKEINDRTAADTALGKRIDAEITNRTSAVANEANSRTTADTAERERATAAEENLQTQVTQLQEAGPGFKQDVFSVVEGKKVNDNVTIVLKDFEYFDKTLKELIKASKSTDSVQIQLPKDAVNIFGGIKQIHNGEIGTSTVEVVFGNGIISLIGAAGKRVNISGVDRLSATEISSETGVLALSEAGGGNSIKIAGVQAGENDNEAVNVAQLKRKQIYLCDTSTFGDDHANPVLILHTFKYWNDDTESFATTEYVYPATNLIFRHILLGHPNYQEQRLDLMSEYDGERMLLLLNDGKLPVQIKNVADGTEDNDAVNKSQLDKLDTDIGALVNRVDNLESYGAFDKVTLNSDNVSATQTSLQGGTNLTINSVSLELHQMYDNLYMIEGYVDVEASSENLISLTIDLKTREFNTIYTTITGDGGTSQQRGNGYVNSYSLLNNDNGKNTKMKIHYLPSASGRKVIGISIMAILNEI